MDYRKIAEEIYEKVGKKENIVSAAHCSTRLRLVLEDNEKCDVKAVEDKMCIRDRNWKCHYTDG